MTAIAPRMDFEQHAHGFYQAVVHLDRAATRQLDEQAWTSGCVNWCGSGRRS